MSRDPRPWAADEDLKATCIQKETAQEYEVLKAPLWIPGSCWWVVSKHCWGQISTDLCSPLLPRQSTFLWNADAQTALQPLFSSIFSSTRKDCNQAVSFCDCANPTIHTANTSINIFLLKHTFTKLLLQICLTNKGRAMKVLSEGKTVLLLNYSHTNTIL